MAIRLSCPACGARLKVSDRAAGRQWKCPKCHSAIVVPQANSAGLVQEADWKEDRPRADRDWTDWPGRPPAGGETQNDSLGETTAVPEPVSTHRVPAPGPPLTAGMIAAIVVLLLWLLGAAASLFPQNDPAAPLFGLVLMGIANLVYCALVAYVLTWVIRDSRDRGIDSAAVWILLGLIWLIWGILEARGAKGAGMAGTLLSIVFSNLLVLVMPFFGLLLYLFSRRKGNLVVCPHCSMKSQKDQSVHGGLTYWGPDDPAHLPGPPPTLSCRTPLHP
jgi:DNA-directed RNA polymerase subunit RPC12/RpoP